MRIWGEPAVFKTRPVTPDLFRGPLRGEEKGLSRHHSLAAGWTPERVRGDEFYEDTDRTSSPQQNAIALAVTAGLIRGPATFFTVPIGKKRDPGSSPG